LYATAIYGGQNIVDDSLAVFPSTWTEHYGVDDPPSPLVIGRLDGEGKPRILYAQKRQVGPEERRRDGRDIAVSNTVFNEMNGKGDHLDVRLKRAGFGLRVRYIPGAKWSLVAAILTFATAVIAAITGLLSGLSKPTAPPWLVAIGCGIAMVVAAVKFVQDVKDKTKK
jgi:hypothetical protein